MQLLVSYVLIMNNSVQSFVVLVGLVIVMSEALGDDSMYSLFMISTVWEADQFYAVFCRHKISKAYFPM